MQNEGAPGDKKRPATEGLMWLLRGLDFTAQALRRSLGDKSEELSVSFTRAYEGSLKQYHNFVVKGAFSLAMKACPYRTDFYAKLGSPPEKVDEELEKWLSALERIVKRMQDLYACVECAEARSAGGPNSRADRFAHLSLHQYKESRKGLLITTREQCI